MADYDLDNAYEINGPKDAKARYGAWAETYDDFFAQGWGYVAPQRIAEIFKAQSDGAQSNGNEPVLDIGAGTGLVTEHLGGMTADAFDITPEMLAIAAQKGIYRALHEGDLTAPLDLPDDAYGGVISSGTFTHGHVGPVCFPELLRVSRPNALFVCGTIAPVLDGLGFGSALAKLVAQGRITPVKFHEIAIYEHKDRSLTHPHAADRGLVMEFRKI